MKKNKIVKIAELLPENLGEATVNKIAEVVQNFITEETNKIKKELESKVLGYIELQKQEIKEHALRELTEENEVFRNAELMKSIKSFLVSELREEDFNNAKGEKEDENTQLKEELSTVVEEMKKVLLENSKLKNTNKVLEVKNVKLLKEQLTSRSKIHTLNEEVKERQAKPFKSSEKAIVINENSVPREENNNLFLSEEVLEVHKRLGKN